LGERKSRTLEAAGVRSFRKFLGHGRDFGGLTKDSYAQLTVYSRKRAPYGTWKQTQECEKFLFNYMYSTYINGQRETAICETFKPLTLITLNCGIDLFQLKNVTNLNLIGSQTIVSYELKQRPSDFLFNFFK
jgi:hypothetical protein